MPPLELIALADGAAVAELVASRLLEACRGTEEPLGLATGRTMAPVYGALVRQWTGLAGAEQEQLRQRWQSFNLDEYVLDEYALEKWAGLLSAHPASFAAFMARHLQTPLGLDPAQVRLPDGAAADPARAARRYATELEAAGGVGLQLLGLGLNGHVGFNEPPCGAHSPCRCVNLSAATRLQNAPAFGDDLAAVPTQAITLGMAEILGAQELLLVVTGATKAGILRRLLSSAPTPLLPASWLGLHPRVTVVADQAALGGISRRR